MGEDGSRDTRWVHTSRQRVEGHKFASSERLPAIRQAPAGTSLITPFAGVGRSPGGEIGLR